MQTSVPWSPASASLRNVCQIPSCSAHRSLGLPPHSGCGGRNPGPPEVHRPCPTCPVFSLPHSLCSSHRGCLTVPPTHPAFLPQDLCTCSALCPWFRESEWSLHLNLTLPLFPCSPPFTSPAHIWAGAGGTHFMHPEYCWQRATGTRTTQRGKAASRPPEAASSSRLSSRCPVSPPSDCPHLGVSRLVRLKGNALSPYPLALALGLCQASPVRPVGLKFLQEDTGPCGTRGTGVGPDKELEDCACLRPQEDNGLVAPGAGAHVHGHSCQLVPEARVEQSQAAAQPPWSLACTQRHHPCWARGVWAWLQGCTSQRETDPQSQLLPGPSCLHLPVSLHLCQWSLPPSLCLPPSLSSTRVMSEVGPMLPSHPPPWPGLLSPPRPDHQDPSQV